MHVPGPGVPCTMPPCFVLRASQTTAVWVLARSEAVVRTTERPARLVKERAHAAAGAWTWKRWWRKAGSRMRPGIGSRLPGQTMRKGVLDVTGLALRPSEGWVKVFPHLTQERASTTRFWRLGDNERRNSLVLLSGWRTAMSVRKRLAEDANKNYDKIERALLEGIEAKKEVWVTCCYCNSQPSSLPRRRRRTRACRLDARRTTEYS